MSDDTRRLIDRLAAAAQGDLPDTSDSAPLGCVAIDRKTAAVLADAMRLAEAAAELERERRTAADLWWRGPSEWHAGYGVAAAAYERAVKAWELIR